MGCREHQVLSTSPTDCATQSQLHMEMESSIIALHEKHHSELQNLTLTVQPWKTFKFFMLAIVNSIQQSLVCVFAKSRWLVLVSAAAAAGSVILVRTIGRPYEEEIISYLCFSLWWLALGVASSIGLGSGLHTFVLYLGPHIALFTMKCVQCGRVDIKTSPYDTIQLNRVPSWLDRNCSGYGLPLYSTPGSRIPILSILHQVQLEAVLWGVGTALGELPPYFISRAAHMSGTKLEVMEDDDSSSKEENGVLGDHLNHTKKWLVSHSHHMNFFTILILASVPNPLFDLAGIMCGQFGVSFWEFFMATLIGKAVIKTHIQTAFIISVCNNQLLDLLENKIIWVLSFIPGVASILPSLLRKLHIAREKYMAASFTVPSNVKVEKWDLSIGSAWNVVVWFMLANFLAKIVNSTAQGLLKERQRKELAALKKITST